MPHLDKEEFFFFEKSRGKALTDIWDISEETGKDFFMIQITPQICSFKISRYIYFISFFYIARDSELLSFLK